MSRLTSKVVHCVAHCEICDMSWQDYKIARRAAQKHAKDNPGHVVTGEEAVRFVYGSLLRGADGGEG